MKTEFTLYARPTPSPWAQFPMEHTYVVCDGHNFNCFGAGKGSDQSREVVKGTASSKWASKVYGNFEGCGDDQLAAGLRVRYNGVCQNASNRILVLAGDKIDARCTKGNLLATLMFGKFGFDFDPYFDRVKNTAQELLQTEPDEIGSVEVDNVIKRIEYGLTADAELEIFHADLPEQFDIQQQLPALTDAQREIFRPIYSDYQSDRKRVWDSIPKQYGEDIAGKKYPAGLLEPWGKCVELLATTLSKSDFEQMFGADPERAIGLLKLAQFAW